MIESIFPYCIYTIRHSQTLADDYASGGSGEFTERLKWTTGIRILQEARQSQQRVAVLFAAAESIVGVTHWALIDDIVLTPQGTIIRFSSLQPLPKKHHLSSLKKLSDGEPLSDNYIRPYVPCRTPAFLQTASSPSVPAVSTPDIKGRSLLGDQKMARYWTCYWPFRYWRPDVHEEGGPIRSSGSNLFSERGVQPGDIAYIISMSGGQLYLGGRMTVKQVLSNAEVARIWSRDIDSLYDAAEWIVDPEEYGTLLHLHRRLSPDLANQIRFQMKSGIKKLGFVTETEWDNGATRGVRELTPESAALLDRIIEITDQWPESDQLITVSEEQLLGGPTQDGSGQSSLPEDVPIDMERYSGGDLPMITEFFDIGSVSVHDDFQAWRTNNQDGKFLTLATRTRANLHGASCQHLGSGPPYFLLEDGYGSLTRKRKICGAEEVLLAWATKNGVNVRRCNQCLRDNLIGNAQVQQGIKEISLPEEVPSGSAYIEGSVQQILINRYERDPRAREACIEHYGTTCWLCGFDFVAKYGEVMVRFIHVHHLKQLSTVGAGYKVAPIEDLRPVCPNCHAVLHRREPPYSLDEVREMLQACRK